MKPYCSESETAQRYVAGTLPAVDAEAFELHLLGCDRCRREVDLALRFAPALAGAAQGASRQATPTAAAPRADSSPPAGAPVTTIRRSRRLLLVGLPALAAAAVLLVVVTRSGSELEQLAGITPPPFSGAPSRSLEATQDVDAGMQAYVRRDFARAAALLGRAAATDSAPSVSFYLGVSRLAAGDARGALQALAVPRSRLASPYRDDAAFFASKAHLRLGQVDSALSILRAIPDNSPAAPPARALAESLLVRRR